MLNEVAIFDNSLKLKEKSMTTLPSLFDLHKQLDPFTVGFDKFYADLEKAAKAISKSTTSYPPYNIKQVDENSYVIELAVAGFAKTDIELTMEGNKLLVKGFVVDSGEKDDTVGYLWKGIAERNFTRAFTLADSVEIKNAELVNGMLKIWMENMVKTQDAIKKIAIK